jgi:prepilin-type N-terminal cleavage/methylation domain-containing protein
MKGMKKIFNRYREGFSLVELMIVVAIIGVLAAIAVPNYAKYQARSRQSEAKTMLSNSYAALKSYAGEANNGGTFTSCLSKIGGAPEMGARRFYALGFGAPAAGATCGPTGGTNCGVYVWEANATGQWVPSTKVAACITAGAAYGSAINASDASFGANSTLNTTKVYGGGNLANTIVKTDKFTAEAFGHISDSLVSDDWTIDQDKRLLNIANGI